MKADVKELFAGADEICGNINREEATPEYMVLAGQEKYEADREKCEAEKIVKNKLQEECPSGHIYPKSEPQCPICYAPKTEEECATCLHMERSHSPHSKACLWTNCECKEYKTIR
jgi:hypothetical protein